MFMLIVVVALTLLVSAMCSLFEATLYSTRMSSLEAARGEPRWGHRAEMFLAMKRDVAVPTSSILILNTVANTSGAALAGMFASRVLGVSMVPAFAVGLTLAILFISEILPKTYGATHWRGLWPLIVWPLAVMNRVLYPLIWVTQRFAYLFTGRTSAPAVTEEEIAAMAHLGAKAGQLTPAELQMINAVLQFDQLVCRQVMVPRRDVTFLDTGWSLPEVVGIAKSTQHTRYPLCRGSLDQVVGLVHIKDLVGLPTDRSFDLASVTRPIRYVPETMALSRLLREMQGTRQHMAVVVDEFGTAVGIITLENVLEQIVGSVQDEFDMETPEIVPEGSGQYSVEGTVSIERVNERLDLDLRDPEVDTLSGFLVVKIGRLPRVGDTVDLDGATAEVIEARGGRASRVRITLRDRPA